MARVRNNKLRRSRPQQGRIEFRIVLAMMVALTIIACLYWMAMTGNRFCCDPDSLVGQVRSKAFTEH